MSIFDFTCFWSSSSCKKPGVPILHEFLLFLRDEYLQFGVAGVPAVVDVPAVAGVPAVVFLLLLVFLLLPV